jgi:glycerophosphoryl diester phosphodiesterase
MMKKAYLLAVVIFSCSMSYAQSSFTLIAHRGAMGYEMENSIKSFQKALELEAPMVELDVFVLKSGELVVFHDDKLNKLTNAKGFIESYTFEDLKREVQLKDGQSIPLLTQVLDICISKTKINIELKGSNTAIPVAALLENYLKKGLLSEDELFISSFKWEELRTMRKLYPHIPIGILTEDDPLDALAIAKELKAVSINPDQQTLSKEIIDQIHAEGFKIYPWTVNSVKDLQRFKDWGVAGVFCNYPDRGKNLH